MEYIESDLQTKLTLYSIPKDSDELILYVRGIDSEREREKLVRGIKEETKCRVMGTLPLPKVYFLLKRHQEHQCLSRQPKIISFLIYKTI